MMLLDPHSCGISKLCGAQPCERLPTERRGALLGGDEEVDDALAGAAGGGRRGDAAAACARLANVGHGKPSRCQAQGPWTRHNRGRRMGPELPHWRRRRVGRCRRYHLEGKGKRLKSRPYPANKTQVAEQIKDGRCISPYNACSSCEACGCKAARAPPSLGDAARRTDHNPPPSAGTASRHAMSQRQLWKQCCHRCRQCMPGFFSKFARS